MTLLKKSSTTNPLDSVPERVLKDSAMKNTLIKLKVMETDEGHYYVIAKFIWSKDEFFIRSRRNKKSPKIFKNLQRLNSHLKKEISPDVGFELLRHQTLPEPEPEQ